MVQFAVLRCCFIGSAGHDAQGDFKENFNRGPIHEILLLSTPRLICTDPQITREFLCFKQ